MNMNKKKTSEFGQGFIYNLVLFAEHFGRVELFERMDKEVSGKKITPIGASCWFNGASDHLFHIIVPEQFKKTKIGKKVLELQLFALDIGHGKRMMDSSVNWKDYEKVRTLTKEIAFLIDKKIGIKPIKAEWE